MKRDWPLDKGTKETVGDTCENRRTNFTGQANWLHGTPLSGLVSQNTELSKKHFHGISILCLLWLLHHPMLNICSPFKVMYNIKG